MGVFCPRAICCLVTCNCANLFLVTVGCLLGCNCCNRVSDLGRDGFNGILVRVLVVSIGCRVLDLVSVVSMACRVLDLLSVFLWFDENLLGARTKGRAAVNAGSLDRDPINASSLNRDAVNAGSLDRDTVNAGSLDTTMGLKDSGRGGDLTNCDC